MPPYRFRLQPVRRLRELSRDEARRELADAFRAAETLAEQRFSIEAELTELRESATNLAGAKQMNVNALLDTQRYELILKGQIQQLDRKAELVEQEIERRRQAVVVAEQSVKVLDALERSGEEKHRAEETRQETKQMDEIAGVLRARQ